MKDANEKTVSFFERRIGLYGSGQLLQPRQEMADWRFEACLRQLWIDPYETVLDVGCGVGDLLEFYRRKNLPRPSQFHGVDIAPKLVDLALQKAMTDWEGDEYMKHVKTMFRTVDVLSSAWWPTFLDDEYDRVFLVGVFGRKEALMGEQDRFFLNALDQAFTHCRRSCSITIQSSYKMTPNEKEAVFDPDWTFRMAKRLTERVVLDHSYAPHDFTLTLWKEPSPFRQLWDATGGWDPITGEERRKT